MECALHAFVCTRTRPGCGRARLEANGEGFVAALTVYLNVVFNKHSFHTLIIAAEMEERREEIDWDPLDTLTPPGDELELDYLDGGSIYKHIGFREISPDQFVALRLQHEDLNQTPPDDELKDHPIARRTFAVFPPTEFVIFTAVHMDLMSRVENPWGVTIEDAMKVLLQKYVLQGPPLRLVNGLLASESDYSSRTLMNSSIKGTGLRTRSPIVGQLETWSLCNGWQTGSK